MRRLWVLLPLVVLALSSPVAAFADTVDDLCGNDPSCTVEPFDPMGPPDVGFGIPGWFWALFVLAAIASIVTLFYRLSVVRGIARNAGLDEGEATRMALLDDPGVSTAYLASHLRPQPAAAATPTPERSTSDRLRELDRLRSEGLVTEQEYAERRTAILGSL